MDNSLVTRADDGAVATLTLNAPERYNVLSDAMLDVLHGRLREVAEDRTIRAVVIRAEGKAFCAGHDLKEMTAARETADGGAQHFETLFERCSELMQFIPKMPQPVIAEVQGVAAAAGCQLVASADMAVASDTARFGVNGVNIGLFCSTPMVALTRAIAPKKAFEMLVTGSFLSADQAMSAGLVNKVVPADTLRGETAAFAALVASKLGVAVKIGKEAFYTQAEMSLADAYDYAGQVMSANWQFRETEKGVGAFLKKTPHEWDQ